MEEMRMKSFRAENFAKYKFLLLIFCLLFAGQGIATAAEGTVSFTVVPSPLSVSISAPDSVYEGERFKIKAEVTNSGEERIKNAVTRIEIDPPSGILVRGKDEKRLGTIAPGQTKTAVWRMRAESAGEYTITVSVSGRDELTGVFPAAGNTTAIEVKERSTFWVFHLAFLLASKVLELFVK